MAREVTELRLVRVVVLAALVALFVLDGGDERPAFIAWSAVLAVVVFVPEIVRPGTWDDWMYDHPAASTIGAAVALGGIGLTNHGWDRALLLALMGALVVAIGRGRLERRVERGRGAPTGGEPPAAD
jgi:hypothetical protein